MSKDKRLPLAIIGAGPAGLSASIYAQRAGVNSTVFEKLTPGGQILTSDKIENYPGFPHPLSTEELMEKMLEQAKNFGMQLKQEEVENIKIEEDEKIIHTDMGNTYRAAALILAMGATSLPLGVPGEEEFKGRGVSYCATCDAPFFRDQRVAVVGGGDAAVKEALYLTRFVQKVYLLHRRDSLRAEKILQERVLNNKNVEVVWNSLLERIYGDEKVKGIQVKNRKTGKVKDIDCEGVFIFVGLKPNSELVKGQIKLNKEGFIPTNEKLETEVPGVFACGDVRKNVLKQVIVACSEGAQAGFMASRYLEEMDPI